jgi:hypothetical protein
VRRRSLILAISASGAVALWSVSVIVAGIVWMFRDSKYVNDVMIPSLLVAAAICFFSVKLTRRWWQQLKAPVPQMKLR